MPFRLFDHLDEVLRDWEQSNVWTSRSALVWPSEASAVLLRPTVESPIVGKCHRAAFFRLIGEPQTNPMDEIGGRRVRMGKAVEQDMTEQSKAARLFVASGVRNSIEQDKISLELDLIVKDPENNQAVIIEGKTYYGYAASKQIQKEGKPKLENLLQLMMYLWEFKTGRRLKEIVRFQLEERKRLESSGRKHRNRIEADLVALDALDDGPLVGKLAYQSRDDCATREFDVEISEYLDGTHIPIVDGNPWPIFTVESIYERYRILQGYWERARDEAQSRLQRLKGVVHPVEVEHPTPEQTKAYYAYWDQVGEEMRKLPYEFFPPAEYEYRYTPEKIEALFQAKLLGKTRYEDWKKAGTGRSKRSKPLIGAWQCSYCSYKNRCVPMEFPDLRHLILDLVAEDLETIAVQE